MYKRLMAVVILLVLAGYMFGCKKNDSILIGFSGSITGHSFELGLPAKNGFLLAVEKINAQGGLNGRLLIPVIKDDESNVETGIRVADAFIEEGVEIVVGYSTSNMTPAVKHAMETGPILFVSPTMSTRHLSGIDDTFFRVVSESDSHGNSHVAILNGLHNVNKAAVVYDSNNNQFARPVYDKFTQEYTKVGGKVLYVNKLDEDRNNYLKIADEIIESRAEGLIFITNAIDAANIIQQIEKQEYEMIISVSGWAMSNDLLQRGGKSVEGVYGITNHVKNLDTDKYKAFEQEYVEKYNSEPSFSSHLAYDSVMVIAEAIRSGKSSEVDSIKEQILKIKDFHGLQDSFSIDAYGDSNRENVITRVVDGVFESLSIPESK